VNSHQHGRMERCLVGNTKKDEVTRRKVPDGRFALFRGITSDCPCESVDSIWPLRQTFLRTSDEHIQ
jgi:hypothetical protein